MVSIVVQPGLLPKWFTGSRPSFSTTFEISSAMIMVSTLSIVLRSTMGL